MSVLIPRKSYKQILTSISHQLFHWNNFLTLGHFDAYPKFFEWRRESHHKSNSKIVFTKFFLLSWLWISSHPISSSNLRSARVFINKNPRTETAWVRVIAAAERVAATELPVWHLWKKSQKIVEKRQRRKSL